MLSPLLKDLMVHLYQSETVRLFSAKLSKICIKKKFLYVVWFFVPVNDILQTRLSINWYQRLDYSQWLIETSEGLTEKTNYHLQLCSYSTETLNNACNDHSTNSHLRYFYEERQIWHKSSSLFEIVNYLL